jgi:DNA-binding transcriptional LysR family regulator
MDFNFELLKTFRLVAAHENYTRAADIMGVNQGTVSRQMRRLEEIVGTQLLISFPKGVRLTDAGRYVVEQMDERLFNFEEIFTRARDLKSSTSGPLQVITAMFGISWLAPHLSQFLAENPGIELMMGTDEYKMLQNASHFSGTYVGLTPAPPPRDTGLIWQELFEFGFYPYAHISYTQKYGMPRTFEDLDHQKIIGYRWSRAYSNIDLDASNPLLFAGREAKKPRRPVMEVDDVMACKVLVENCVGIGMLPIFHVVNTQLVPVLQGVYDKTVHHKHKGYIVYPPYLRGNQRLQNLISFIKDKIIVSTQNMEIQWALKSE